MLAYLLISRTGFRKTPDSWLTYTDPDDVTYYKTHRVEPEHMPLCICQPAMAILLVEKIEACFALHACLYYENCKCK